MFFSPFSSKRATSQNCYKGCSGLSKSIDSTDQQQITQIVFVQCLRSCVSHLCHSIMHLPSTLKIVSLALLVLRVHVYETISRLTRFMGCSKWTAECSYIRALYESLRYANAIENIYSDTSQHPKHGNTTWTWYAAKYLALYSCRYVAVRR